MSMDYYGRYADVIAWESIKKLCPKVSTLVELALADAGLCMDEWLQALAEDDSTVLQECASKDLTDKQTDELMRLFDVLDAEFREATRTGKSSLSLVACYECGDEIVSRGNEPAGGFFHVDGVYAQTPAGRKFDNLYERINYVTAD